MAAGYHIMPPGDDPVIPSMFDIMTPTLWNTFLRTSFRQPFLQIAITLQTHPADARVRAGVVAPFKGWVDCYTRLRAAHGFRSFWRGNLLTCSARMLNNMMSFGLTQSLPKRTNRMMYTFAPLINAAVLYPLETLITRACADPNFKLATFWSSPRGLRGLYDGFLFHLLLILLRRVFDGVSHTIASSMPDRANRTVAYRISLIASLFALYPFETALHRMQVQSELPLRQHRYFGVIDCMRRVSREEGAWALYRGSAYQLLIGLTGLLGDSLMF